MLAVALAHAHLSSCCSCSHSCLHCLHWCCSWSFLFYDTILVCFCSGSCCCSFCSCLCCCDVSLPPGLWPFACCVGSCVEELWETGNSARSPNCLWPGTCVCSTPPAQQGAGGKQLHMLCGEVGVFVMFHCPPHKYVLWVCVFCKLDHDRQARLRSGSFVSNCRFLAGLGRSLPQRGKFGGVKRGCPDSAPGLSTRPNRARQTFEIASLASRRHYSATACATPAHQKTAPHAALETSARFAAGVLWALPLVTYAAVRYVNAMVDDPELHRWLLFVSVFVSGSESAFMPVSVSVCTSGSGSGVLRIPGDGLGRPQGPQI